MWSITYNHNHSFIVLATVNTIVNYNCKAFIVQATGVVIYDHNIFIMQATETICFKILFQDFLSVHVKAHGPYTW